MISFLFLLQTHVFRIDSPNKTLLYFDPLDVIELSVEKGFACWFGGWDDDLELEVDANNGRGRSLTYGPYQNNDKVVGAAQTISDFVIRFSNNSPFKHSVAIRCEKSLLDAKYAIYLGYPVEKFDIDYYNISELQEPILYSNLEKSRMPISYIVFIIILAFLNFFILVFTSASPDAFNHDLAAVEVKDIFKTDNACWEAFKEIVSFGGSAGSFLGNVVALFRIFQRLSATSTFKTKFSTDAKSMFSWATNIVKIVLDKLPSEHLSDFELFSVYSYGYSIFMIFFILSCSTEIDRVIFLFPLIFFSIILGVGFGFLGVSTGWAAGLITVGAIFVIGSIIFLRIGSDEMLNKLINPIKLMFNLKELENVKIEITIFQVTFATTCSLLIFLIVISNILTKFTSICNIVTILFSIIIVVNSIASIVAAMMKKVLRLINILIDGCFTVLSLLLVPTCETFVAVIESQIGPKWYIVLYFSVINLMFPIVLSVVLILSEHKNVREKYKNGIRKWFEVGDVLQKVLYAMLAAYDIPWACVGVQAAWIVLFCIARPCNAISDNVMCIGESLVLIIVNIIVAVNADSDKLFPLSLCVGLIVLACLPVIIASYCFFIWDFSFGRSDLFEKKGRQFAAAVTEKVIGINVNSFRFLNSLCNYMIPISLLLYGMNIPFMYGKVRATV